VRGTDAAGLKSEEAGMGHTFRSFFSNSGGKAIYIVEVYKSSILAIHSTGNFAKNANANCGMWV
jgi:hypothetical protein